MSSSFDDAWSLGTITVYVEPSTLSFTSPPVVQDHVPYQKWSWKITHSQKLNHFLVACPGVTDGEPVLEPHELQLFSSNFFTAHELLSSAIT
jgi:hypothetical protein